MRAVLDTNLIISALFWKGPPRQILNLAFLNKIEHFTSFTLLSELEDVLQREKFLKHLKKIRRKPVDLVLSFASLAKTVDSPQIEPIILDDPEDNEVLACALAAEA